MKPAAEVIFPLPLRRSFLYRIPESLEPQAEVGRRVRAPLGRRVLTGCLVRLTSDIPADLPELKDLQEILVDHPPLTRNFMDFTRRLSEYFHSPWGELVFAALPADFNEPSILRAVLTPEGKEHLESGKLRGRPRETAALLARGPHAPGHLARKLEFRNVAGLLSRMKKRGLVAFENARPRTVVRERAEPRTPPLQMELGFSAVSKDNPAAPVIRAVGQGRFAAFCLFGGREPREAVYRDLAAAALRKGGTFLVLVPEIARIDGMAERLQCVLPAGRAAVLHGRLTGKQREDQWRRIRSGAAAAVIGPRSALLAPLENLRLAIVDDEQDEAYVQTESPAYDARAGVRIRCETEGAVAVMGSSAPLVESFHHARENGTLVILKKEARENRAEILEFRSRSRLLAPGLVEKIGDRLRRQERVVVCVTQRGYVTFLSCRSCGARPLCRRCDIPLFYSREDERLACRTCRRDYPFNDECSACGDRVVQGKAAGLQAVVEELETNFPGTKVATFDPAAARGKAAARVLEAFISGQKPILAGTGLMARSDPLPRCSLAAVLHPETLLYAPDFRAGWKTYQFVRRASNFVHNTRQSEFLVQTSLPGHPAVREAVLGSYEGYFEGELALRRMLGDPPFSRLMEINLQGESLRTLAAQARTAAALLREWKDKLEVFGPAKASAAKVRGMHRVQIVLRAETDAPLHAAADDLVASIRGVRVHIALS